MAPTWHTVARKLRGRGKSLSEIGKTCGVSPQAVSVALDPKKQQRRREYIKNWNREARADPKVRKRHQKIDRDSHRRRRAIKKRAN